MLFNSYAFAVFFPVVTGLYFVVPQRNRWLLLLLAGCVFYAWFIPAYLLVLALLIGIDYGAGLAIEASQGTRRKLSLGVSLVANLGLLSAFKYYNFAASSASWLALHLLGRPLPLPESHWLLPLGLSFHTFQAMSYTMEVYRGRYPAERHLGYYAVYVMFYPQLVAGPIERPQNLLPQLREEHRFEYERVVRGLQLMTWGLFKKIVVADRLAVIVNAVYGLPIACDGPAVLLATFLFGFQVYCDFSGYSDIAIGAAEVMGFRLMRNFNRPMFAQSLAEFWQRWHISLTSWFRDYIYIPLGGNRRGPWIGARNVLLVFALSGLWHGAAWTFVLFGVYHGVMVVVQRLFLQRIPFPRLRGWVGWVSTVILVTASWILFRSADWTTVTIILARLPVGWDQLGTKTLVPTEQILPEDYAGTMFAVAVLIAVEWFQEHRGSWRERLALQPGLLRWAIYYGVMVSLVCLSSISQQPFLYFQF